MPEALLRRRFALRLPVPSLPTILLLLVLAVALALRLYGVNWDSGYGFHPDERSLYLRAGCMYDLLTTSPGYQDCIHDFPQTEPGLPNLNTFLDANRSPLNPHWFPLGSILIYVLVFFRFIIEPFTDVGTLDLRYVGRPLSALADVGSVLLVYVLGRRMYSQKVGLLGAAFTALAVIHVQNSHFYRPETFSVFFILASFWAMWRMAERRRVRDSVLLGVLVGVAMAPKVSVLPLVLPLALAYGYWVLNEAGGRWSGVTPMVLQKALVHAATAGATAIAIFFVLTPYALLDFTAFVADLAAQTNMARQAGLWPFTVQYIDIIPFVYQIQQTTVWGLGLPLGLVAWASVPLTAVMVWRNPETRRADLLLLAWVVPQFVLLESFEVRFLRYVFPLMPVMLLMGARMLLWLVEYLQGTTKDVTNLHPSGSLMFRWVGLKMLPHLPRLGVVLIALVLFSTLFYALAFEKVYASEHPAVAASRWIGENVPPGTAIVSDNHWDEFIPGLYRYDVWQFQVYEPDSTEKMGMLARRMARSEYLVFYSYRPFVSAARAGERYPLSSRYYQELFNGNLGYRLERTFTSYPKLLGVSFRDSPYGWAGLPEPEPLLRSENSPIILNLGYADDNVVGYDHPQVLLFRNVQHVTEPVLLHRLSGQPTAQQTGSPMGLMLSEEDKAVQRGGGTWSDIFDRDSWTNKLPVLSWILAVELVYLVALPMAMFVFRPLPDRGIVLARVLGLLAVGYITWVVVSLGWLTFSTGTILLGVLVVGALSLLVLVARWREIKEFVVQRWKLLFLGEVLFLVAFMAFVGIRASNPDLWHPFRGGEKPMELAYLNAVVRSTTLPPYDPWFAGGYLNYYYWGYFVTALPIRISGVIPTTAFNLAVPMFFALTFTGAYSLVYNLAEGMWRSLHDGSRERHTSRGTTPGQVLDSTALSSDVSSKGQEPVTPVQRAIRSPVTAGLLAGTFISIIGNLDGIVQLGQWAWTKIASPGQAGLAFDFWRSSRMIPPLENLDPSPLAFWVPDKVPGAPDISYHITEFPFFTFLFADLHAHMMVIPFTLLVIGLGLSIVVGLKNAGWLWGLTASIALGLALGSLWVINSWDYPPYLVLAVTLLGLAVLLRQGSFPGKIGLLAVLGAGVVAVSVLAFLPFHQVYETFDAGIAASKWRTPLDRYLGIHGLFLFLAATFLIHQTRHDLLELFRGFLPKSRCVRELGEISSRRSWLITYLGLGLLAVVYLAVAGYWTAALLLVPLVLTGLALWNALVSEETARPNSLVPLVLLAMALAIGIGVDFVRLNGDIGRMNTLFKLYLEGWVLFSLVSSYMLWRLASRGWFRWPWGWARGTWVGVLALLLVSSLIYPVLGTRARVADRFSDGPVSLDGVAYMNNAIHMEGEQLLKLKWDLQAIEWLQDNVEGSPVVLEAHHEQYYWSARIASYTGLPTVIGWPWHQIQQRTAYSYAIRDRAEDVRQIYNTTDVRFAKELLDKYEVEYIVVGELERAYYSEKGLGKFEEMVERGWVKPVFESQKVRIFRVM